MLGFGELLNIFLGLDQHLSAVAQQYGVLAYAIFFLIVFFETGVVITPFLPGDSLLFAAGAIAAQGTLDVGVLFLVFSIAAIAGDTVNYWIGHYVGRRIIGAGNGLVKKDYVERTQLFYEKHGGKTIVLARFVPIIRTFAPFVAGIAKMDYLRFVGYNIAGGIAWTAIFVFGGYYFGGIPIVRQNFSTAVIAIMIVSILPVISEYLKGRKAIQKKT